jgi:hypothetical protein
LSPERAELLKSLRDRIAAIESGERRPKATPDLPRAPTAPRVSPPAPPPPPTAPRVSPPCPPRPPAPGGLPPGEPALEALFGAWPRPGISEIFGPLGSGRLALVLPALQALTRLDRPAAVVDPEALLYPPGLPEVQLERLLVARPGPERALWTAEQLLASGVFPLVLLIEPPRVGATGQRLRAAATRGDAALLVVARFSDERLPAALRLEVSGRSLEAISLRVRRRRGGPPGACLTLRAATD